jgi:hypothetical protein
MIPEIEQLIELSECDGKPCKFKARIQEKNEPEYYYQKTVDGLRYGPLGMYTEGGLWYCIHARSGRSLGIPFSTLEDARRLLFLLRKLAAWTKVDWKDDRTYEADPLFWMCVTASEYCSNLEGDYDQLVEAVKAQLPSDSVYVEEVVEFHEVQFGVAVT